jgi:NADPH:quinone reductase-like Zn-dependent oxidoreductase
MPRVVRFHRAGGPEVLEFEEHPLRQPKAGEVLLRVQAVGLNRAELMYMHGQYLEQPRLPSGIGYEASGVVEAVGPAVEESWVGRSVSTLPGFSMNDYPVLGEEAIVPATNITCYPPNLSPVEAAAVWMAFLTAWGGLVHIGRITKKDAVLIPAASSSVGLAAIHIAKDLGATAIATTRTAKKRDELVALGADHVIVTDDEDLAERVRTITRGKGARVIFDPVAGDFVERLAEAAAPRGVLIEYGLLSLQPTPFPMTAALRKGLAMRGYTLHEVYDDPDLSRSARQYVFDRLADGRFKPQISRTFSFAEAPEAFRYLESNEQIGKVVIRLG